MPRAHCLFVALIAFGLMAPGSVAAREAQPGFTLGAVGFDSYFHYRVDPDSKERGTVRLINLSRRPLTVVLRAADVTTAATGGLQYGTTPPGADARWLTLDSGRVRLAGGGARSVGFNLHVPATAAPGDHFAGIVALNQRDVRAARRRTPPRGLQLRFLPRLAIAVQATIPGGPTHELRSGNAGIEVTPSATNATLLLRNTGNRLIRATTGQLTLLQDSRVLVRHQVSLDSFVPNTQITLRVPFKGTPARGAYRLRGTLRPIAGRPVRIDEQVSFGESAARELQQETGREAKGSGVPALLVAVLGAALLLLLATLAALLHRQRRLAGELADARCEAHGGAGA